MARIGSALKKELLESLTHDCLFEMRFARTVIQRTHPSLPIITTATSRWLVFQKKDGTHKTIDLYTVTDICGVFLFDGIKDPERADMPNIATGLWNYFDKAGE